MLMSQRKVLLAGATGLVGGEILPTDPFMLEPLLGHCLQRYLARTEQ